MREVIACGVVCFALLGGAFGQGSGGPATNARLAQNAVLTLDHGWQFRQIAAGSQQ
jgi:hypothetical protein